MFRIPLRRFNDTLRLPLPIDFVRDQGLSMGDYCHFIVEADGSVQLKFFKIEEMERKQLEAEARQPAA